MFLSTLKRRRLGAWIDSQCTKQLILYLGIRLAWWIPCLGSVLRGYLLRSGTKVYPKLRRQSIRSSPPQTLIRFRTQTLYSRLCRSQQHQKKWPHECHHSLSSTCSSIARFPSALPFSRERVRAPEAIRRASEENLEPTFIQESSQSTRVSSRGQSGKCWKIPLRTTGWPSGIHWMVAESFA